tara:strand:- start:47 stop:1651 length:1605 start_codon:yes stop_codon:yes gene_type:complete
MAEQNIVNSTPGAIVNWGSLFAGVSNSLQESAIKKKEDSEKSQKEASDDYLEIAKGDYGANQTYQDLTLKALEKTKSMLLEASTKLSKGEISQPEYDQIKMNLENTMNSWSSASLNYDEVITTAEKKSNSEKGMGYFESVLLDNYVQNGNMSDKDIRFSEDGTGFLQDTNLESGEVLSESNIQNISNPQNINSPRVYLTQNVGELTDGFKGKQTINSDGSITKNYLNDETYVGQVAAHTFQLLKDPRRALSVLNDNGFQKVDEKTGFISTYEVYMNKDQKKSMLDERVLIARGAMLEPREVPVLDNNKKQKENSDGTPMTEMVDGTEMTPDQEKAFREEQESYLIGTKRDSQGNLQPVITSQFRNDAGNLIRETINSQIGSTYRPKILRSVRKEKEEKPVDPNDFAVVNDIDNLLKNKGKNLNAKKIQDINQALVNRVVGKTKVVFHKGKFKVLNGEKNRAKRYAPGSSTEDWNIYNGFTGTVLNNAEDFAKYFIGGNSSLDTYNKKKALRDKEGGGKNTSKRSAEDLINQYSK